MKLHCIDIIELRHFDHTTVWSCRGCILSQRLCKQFGGANANRGYQLPNVPHNACLRTSNCIGDKLVLREEVLRRRFASIFISLRSFWCYCFTHSFNNVILTITLTAVRQRNFSQHSTPAKPQICSIQQNDEKQECKNNKWQGDRWKDLASLLLIFFPGSCRSLKTICQATCRRSAFFIIYKL